jgi:UDP-N-acetylmuramyl pentapeptide phosphotransferase/UDP-N-acetylglucosamine-1-phosphate transferase
LVAAAAGAAAGRVVLARAPGLDRSGTLARTNFRGRPVSLAGGPAVAVAASVGGGVGAVAAGQPRLAGAALVAGLGSGAVGLYDDVVSGRPGQVGAKGFRGHLGALREGRVTSGMVKIAGVSAAALVASALVPSARPGRRRTGRAVEVALGAGVIAGAANLTNLFDLRPGRALKVGLAVGAPLVVSAGGPVAAGAVGAAGAVLKDDLAEQVMIGDAGANALGALLGVALAARTGIAGRAALLAGIAALTAASEKVSFTAVIDATPGLRQLDRLGRRP